MSAGLIITIYLEVRTLNLSEAPAVLTVDTLFTWYSEIAQTDCQCRLRIYKITFDKAVIIASELPNNPGRSISDEALTLIHLVCYKFGQAPAKTMWIEHYPPGYLKQEDTYEQVMLGQFCVRSKRIAKPKLESLLGVSL